MHGYERLQLSAQALLPIFLVTMIIAHGAGNRYSDTFDELGALRGCSEKCCKEKRRLDKPKLILMHSPHFLTSHTRDPTKFYLPSPFQNVQPHQA